MKFMSNAYTNHNTNPKILTAGILTLNDRHDAFESFCAPVFGDFIRNYFLSDSETVGFLDTSFLTSISLVINLQISIFTRESGDPLVMINYTS